MRRLLLEQVEDRRRVPPDRARDRLRVRRDSWLDVEHARRPVVEAGPAGITGRGEGRPRLAHLRRHRLGHRRDLADQDRRLSLRQVAEDQGHVQPVAGTEHPAHAGRRPGQLVEVRPATRGELGVSQGDRRHAEQPVGAHHLVQLLRVGVGVEVGLWVGREHAGALGGLLRSHPAAQPAQHAEQPLLVRGVADQQVDLAGEPQPRCRRQHLAVDDWCEHHRGVGRLAPAVGEPEHVRQHRVAGRGQQPRVGGRQIARVEVELGGARPGDVGGQGRREEGAGHALRDGALEQAPVARGIASSAATDPPPADWPKIVTWPGRPPNPPTGTRDRILDFSTAVTGNLFFVPTADFLADPPARSAEVSTPGTTEEPPTPTEPPANDGSLGIGSLRGSVSS